MMRKIFGIKSISHLIYGLLMLAPILAIGVKCAYVVINKNAKDSYSDELIVSQTNITNVNQLNENEIYTFTYNNATTSNTPFIYYKTISIDWTNYGFDSGRTYEQFALFGNGQIILKDTGGNSVTKQHVWGNTLLTFTMLSATNTGNSTFNVANVYTTIYKQNSLDNVFYYAIDEIIQDNNFGKINFTGWFDNMMLDNNIQINQTYIHLFNWYLNYTLFISCAYILWLVLMWFVNFARKLLDRGMNYDW